MKDKYGEGRERCRGASGSASDQGKEQERSFIRANWHVVSTLKQTPAQKSCASSNYANNNFIFNSLGILSFA